MIYPYWLINFKKYTTLKQDVKNDGNGGEGGRDIWELSVLLLNFSINLKLN